MPHWIRDDSPTTSTPPRSTPHQSDRRGVYRKREWTGADAEILREQLLVETSVATDTKECLQPFQTNLRSALPRCLKGLRGSGAGRRWSTVAPSCVVVTVPSLPRCSYLETTKKFRTQTFNVRFVKTLVFQEQTAHIVSVVISFPASVLFEAELKTKLTRVYDSKTRTIRTLHLPKLFQSFTAGDVGLPPDRVPERP